MEYVAVAFAMDFVVANAFFFTYGKCRNERSMDFVAMMVILMLKRAINMEFVACRMDSVVVTMENVAQDVEIVVSGMESVA